MHNLFFMMTEDIYMSIRNRINPIFVLIFFLTNIFYDENSYFCYDKKRHVYNQLQFEFSLLEIMSWIILKNSKIIGKFQVVLI